MHKTKKNIFFRFSLIILAAMCHGLRETNKKLWHPFPMLENVCGVGDIMKKQQYTTLLDCALECFNSVIPCKAFSFKNSNCFLFSNKVLSFEDKEKCQYYSVCVVVGHVLLCSFAAYVFFV